MSESTFNGTVLCVGRLYCDLIFTGVPQLPSMGTEVYAEGFGLHAGGGAFITAAHLSRIGFSTALGAFLPNSPFDALMRDELRQADLDLTFCTSSAPGLDPQLTVAISGGRDRAFLTRRSGAAFPDLSIEDLQRLNVAHVHIGELATLVEKPEIVEIARAVDASLSLDCGWDGNLVASDITPLLGDIDLFLPNQTEFNHLQELGVPGPVNGITVVKQGANGATAYCRGNRCSEPATQVNVVDTTGAGDAFNAGFLSAWLGGKAVKDCLRAGNLQGAAAISQIGGFHQSTLSAAQHMADKVLQT